MGLHLTSSTFYLTDANDVDTFIHDASVWFNAALSSNTPWCEAEVGSGFVGLDRITKYLRWKSGNDLTIFQFVGVRKVDKTRSDPPPFVVQIATTKRLGQGMITLSIGNGHFVPFAVAMLKDFSTWINGYFSSVFEERRTFIYEHSMMTNRDYGHLVPELAITPFGFSESMLFDSMIMSDFMMLCNHIQEVRRKQSGLYARVFGDQLAKFMPKDLLPGLENCPMSYEQCYDVPIHLAPLYCDPQKVLDFHAGVSRRLTTQYFRPIRETYDTYQQAEKINHRKVMKKGVHRKSARKSLCQIRDRTRYCMISGNFEDFNEDGGTKNDANSQTFMYEVHEELVELQRAIRAEEPKPAVKLPPPRNTCFGDSLDALPPSKPDDLRKPRKYVEKPYKPTMMLSMESHWTVTDVGHIEAFYVEWNQRAEARELAAMPTAHEQLQIDNENLERANLELELRIQSLEEDLAKSEQAYREQKSLADHLSETLSEKSSELVGTEDLEPLSFLLAEPSRQISASEALRIAEVLSAGRLVVLPSAKRSADEVPAEFHAGTKLLQLLMRLSMLWLPKFLEEGDAVARKIFTNNTYSAKETKILQSSKRLMQSRTFTYRGREVSMIRHLCIGIKRDTSRTLRAYFDVDQEEGKVVLGWCGEHLPLASKGART